MLNTIYDYVDWAAKNDAETGLIDVTYNGGGIICYSDFLLAALFQPWKFLATNTSIPPAYGVYDLRHNAILDLVIANRA